MAGGDFYSAHADWWRLFSPVADYAEEAARYAALLQRHGPVKAVLELGSGGGNIAYFHKRHFELTLTDLSPAMLEQSRAINPECAHRPGDMRTLRLDRTFDAVFVHDAVMSMVTAADLRAAMATAFAHLRPGGVALFCPDCVAEDFHPYTDCGGADGDDGRALRYLEWVRHTADPERIRWTFVFALQHADGRLEEFVEDDEGGLFTEARWIELLREVGFVDVEAHRAEQPENPPGEGPPGQVQLLARRPGPG